MGTSRSGRRDFNISNPSSPSNIAEIRTRGHVRGLFISGSYLYVADGPSGLQIIDISDPASPTRARRYDTPDEASGVVVARDYAYVTDAASGLIILEYAPCVITVTSPNGEENWCAGESQDIAWTSENTSGNVKIEYSTNGGVD